MKKRTGSHLGGQVSRVPRAGGRNGGFSLIELLTVIAIITVIASLAAPAFNSMTSGTNMNRAGQLVGDQLMLARQEAITKNREVRVLFYYLPNTVTPGWRGIQIFRVEPTAGGTKVIPVTRLSQVPEGILINADPALSPLLAADPTLAGTVNVPAYGDVQVVGFRFRATGLPDSTVNDTNNFVTLNNAKAAGNPPANYYTIQINPITGKVIIYRP
ncbi:MAG: Verru_Chthon cassette protein D [Chthoniobacteraceae bacterium]